MEVRSRDEVIRPRVERLAERTCGLCAKTVGRPHRHGTWQLGRRCRLRHPISDCWAAAMSAVRTVPTYPGTPKQSRKDLQPVKARDVRAILSVVSDSCHRVDGEIAANFVYLLCSSRPGRRESHQKLKQDRVQACLAGATSASSGSCQLQVVVNRGCPSCQASYQCSCHRPRHR